MVLSEWLWGQERQGMCTAPSPCVCQKTTFATSLGATPPETGLSLFHQQAFHHHIHVATRASTIPGAPIPQYASPSCLLTSLACKCPRQIPPSGTILPNWPTHHSGSSPGQHHFGQQCMTSRPLVLRRACISPPRPNPRIACS